MSNWPIRARALRLFFHKGSCEPAHGWIALRPESYLVKISKFCFKNKLKVGRSPQTPNVWALTQLNAKRASRDPIFHFVNKRYVSVKEKGCLAISLSTNVIFSSYVVFQTQVTGRIVIISENFERKNWVSFSIMFSLKASPLSNRKFLAWYLLRYHLKMWVGYRLVRKAIFLPIFSRSKRKGGLHDSTG